jgi:hypothetical protein
LLPPSIAQQQQALGLGVVFHAVLHPPVRNAVAAELAGVAAGVEVHVAFIARQVIESMWNQLAITRAGEVMIERLHWSLRMDVSCSGEVADQLLLLGVDADPRSSGPNSTTTLRLFILIPMQTEMFSFG